MVSTTCYGSAQNTSFSHDSQNRLRPKKKFHKIQRKGIRLFNKSNGISFMNRRFTYVSMEICGVSMEKVPRQGHFIFVIFTNVTIGSVPITAV